LVFLIIRLSPARNVKRISQGVLGLISAWAIGEFFAFAFQDPLPNTWDYTQNDSVSVPALYYTMAAGDIITDLIVIVLPAYVIWQVLIPVRKRLAVVAVFASRVAVVICSAIRVGTLPNYVDGSDRSWDAVGPQTWIQVIQCLSIITACIPCLKPFLESLESGFMDMSMGKIRGETYGHSGGGSGRHGTKKTGNNSYVLSSFTSGGHPASKKRNVGVNVDSVSPSPNREIQEGHYLDTQHTRNPSVAESERVLTSKSSDGSHDIEGKGSWEMPKPRLGRQTSSDRGITVTKEVEVRSESVGMANMGQGRRW
jgi:hypothetical protein